VEWDGETWKLCRNVSKIRLQLESLQGLASDGFVPPAAIEPNHDMRHRETWWNCRHPQSENETAVRENPL